MKCSNEKKARVTEDAAGVRIQQQRKQREENVNVITSCAEAVAVPPMNE